MPRPTSSLHTLDDVLACSDEGPAVLGGSSGPCYTRGQLRQLAVQFAASLRASSVKPGDVLTIVDANTVEFIVAFVGATLARAVAAPLQAGYTKEEFAFYMEDAGSRLLVVGRKGNEAAEAAAAAASLPVLSLAVQEDDLQLTAKPGSGALDLLVAEAGAVLDDPPTGKDVALFLHTSGTTSRPKGVPLTHANLAASLANIIQTYEFGPEDRSLLVMPLFHVHGLMAGLLSPLAAGAAVILPAAGRFSASTFWADAQEHGATFYTAVPTMHQILLSRAAADYPADNPPPLRVIRSCSASLAPATLAALEKAFKAPVLEAYAMTEASHQMTSNPLPKHGAHKPGSVGKAQGSVQVAILDEQCNTLPAGQVGEVCIRGPNVTAGYRNNPKANEEAYAGGWFHTGDQGQLDEEGYLTLTGRLKELINRGGEKISPIEVDSALLASPLVAEAVSFGIPDEHYGEVVAAAVVLTEEGKTTQEVEKAITAFLKQRIAPFKVPVRLFVTDSLPKSATGKIQRRIMPAAFLGDGQQEEGKREGKGQEASGGGSKGSRAGGQIDTSAFPTDTFFLAAQALARLGVKHMFGVVGIPVTQLASAVQAAGIRFIACRNEQAAGYAAAAAGFLTGRPGVLLTVSGPGVVHGLAGLSDAQVNCWPMIMLSGSCDRGEMGKGAFQELDQMAAVKPYVKLATQPGSAAEVPRAIAAAYQAAMSGKPGAAYVDLPADVLMAEGLSAAEAQAALEAVPRAPSPPAPSAPQAAVQEAAALLLQARKPLLVVGKGAALGRSEGELRELVSRFSLPFLATSMGRGVVPDDSPLCANAARSMALSQTDVALVIGARLNWQLHFGEAPKWGSGVKFILVDIEPLEHDAAKCAVVLPGDAATTVRQLIAALDSGAAGAGQAQAQQARQEWLTALQAKAEGARQKLAARLKRVAYPLDYSTALGALKAELAAHTERGNEPAVVVSEGANTMDNARLLLEPVVVPRSRLDAGTWGTMGVGPGYATAAAVEHPGRLVVAVEGDSAFGFSGMEVETICRYRLPVTFVIFNNGGVYGGDRREQRLQELAAAGLAAAGYPDDLPPTAFVPGAQYHLLAQAFGGVGVAVDSAEQLSAALRQAFTSLEPTVVNVSIDPQAGVESGNVHSFNAPKPAA